MNDIAPLEGDRVMVGRVMNVERNGIQFETSLPSPDILNHPPGTLVDIHDYQTGEPKNDRPCIILAAYYIINRIIISTISSEDPFLSPVQDGDIIYRVRD